MLVVSVAYIVGFFRIYGIHICQILYLSIYFTKLKLYKIMGDKFKHILLTGLPGSGKTTLIKKICDELTKKEYKVNGFYTEELRSNSNCRLGFDVVTIKGNRCKLARITQQVPPCEMTNYKVGSYVVFPSAFEEAVLPIFSKKDNMQVLVLDEIGKMELFSNEFKKEVNDAFKTSRCLIIATIPERGYTLPIIEAIRNKRDSSLFTIDKNNRDHIFDDIMKKINYELQQK